MSTQDVLQLLVFPCLAAIWFKLDGLQATVAKVKERLAAGDERLKDQERRISRLEESRPGCP